MKIMLKNKTVFEAEDCYIDEALYFLAEEYYLRTFTAAEFLRLWLDGDAAVPHEATLGETLEEYGLGKIADERDLIIFVDETDEWILMPGKSVLSDDETAFQIIQDILHKYNGEYTLVRS